MIKPGKIGIIVGCANCLTCFTVQTTQRAKATAAMRAAGWVHSTPKVGWFCPRCWDERSAKWNNRRQGIIETLIARGFQGDYERAAVKIALLHPALSIETAVRQWLQDEFGAE